MKPWPPGDSGRGCGNAAAPRAAARLRCQSGPQSFSMPSPTEHRFVREKPLMSGMCAGGQSTCDLIGRSDDGILP